MISTTKTSCGRSNLIFHRLFSYENQLPFEMSVSWPNFVYFQGRLHPYLIFHWWSYLWADFALILNLYRDITINPYYGYVGDWVDSMRHSWTWLTVWRYTAVKNDHLRSIYERPTWLILAELGNKPTCQSPSVDDFVIYHRAFRMYP